MHSKSALRSLAVAAYGGGGGRGRGRVDVKTVDRRGFCTSYDTNSSHITKGGHSISNSFEQQRDKVAWLLWLQRLQSMGHCVWASKPRQLQYTIQMDVCTANWYTQTDYPGMGIDSPDRIILEWE